MAQAPKWQPMLDKARAALGRSDGIAAEIELKRALSAGAPRDQVAAGMGEALIDQGDYAGARQWLAPGKFAPGDAARGFRLLGRLEMQQGNLRPASLAYNRALAREPRSADLWIDVARLRYAGAEHLLAIEAADHALKLDPGNVSALQYRGEMVRDQYGLAAALPWFERALSRDSDNIAALGEYGATLGDMGRATQTLATIRRVLTLDPGNARALFSAAVLAARAGNYPLARALLNKTDGQFDAVPAKLLLDGVLELRAGNQLLAIEALEALVARQPANPTAQALLARAYYAQGNFLLVAERFAPLAARGDASPYLLTVVARSQEALGRRDLAVPLLQRAALASDRPFAASPFNQPVGALIANANPAGAAAEAERRRQANPGSADAQALAGDAQLALGNGPAAAERYRLAARVRLPESLLVRLVASYGLAGQTAATGPLVNTYLAQNPTSRAAARLAAAASAGQGDWSRARMLLEFLRDNGGAGDVRLLADLSLAQLRDGDKSAAAASARTAYRLQPASSAASLALAMALASAGTNKADANALLANAVALGGENALTAETKRLLSAKGG